MSLRVVICALPLLHAQMSPRVTPRSGSAARQGCNVATVGVTSRKSKLALHALHLCIPSPSAWEGGGGRRCSLRRQKRLTESRRRDSRRRRRSASHEPSRGETNTAAGRPAIEAATTAARRVRERLVGPRKGEAEGRRWERSRAVRYTRET